MPANIKPTNKLPSHELFIVSLVDSLMVETTLWELFIILNSISMMKTTIIPKFISSWTASTSINSVETVMGDLSQGLKTHLNIRTKEFIIKKSQRIKQTSEEHLNF